MCKKNEVKDQMHLEKSQHEWILHSSTSTMHAGRDRMNTELLKAEIFLVTNDSFTAYLNGILTLNSEELPGPHWSCCPMLFGEATTGELFL